MPVYCYQMEDDSIVERIYPMGEAPKTIEENGMSGARSFAAECKSVPSTTGWPLECVASGVHAEDRGKLEKEFTKLGVPTRVSADGNPIYTDKNHRKKALKARGFHDKASFA